MQSLNVFVKNYPRTVWSKFQRKYAIHIRPSQLNYFYYGPMLIILVKLIHIQHMLPIPITSQRDYNNNGFWQVSHMHSKLINRTTLKWNSKTTDGNGKHLRSNRHKVKDY